MQSLHTYHLLSFADVTNVFDSHSWVKIFVPFLLSEFFSIFSSPFPRCVFFTVDFPNACASPFLARHDFAPASPCLPSARRTVRFCESVKREWVSAPATLSLLRCHSLHLAEPLLPSKTPVSSRVKLNRVWMKHSAQCVDLFCSRGKGRTSSMTVYSCLFHCCKHSDLIL